MKCILKKKTIIPYVLFYTCVPGSSIEQLCEIAFTDPLGYPPPEKDRLSMVRAARALLQNVTRVLLLADIVVVKQLMVSKDKVNHSSI